MLDMAEIHYIKRLRDKEGLSVRAISQKLGINWRTAKKYADGAVPVPSVRKTRRGMMYEEPYGDIVDVWLEEDSRMEPKYRRTNNTIYQALKQHHGFPGSYRTVCVYIQERKPVLKQEHLERYERLEHPPGEAQVDFGHMRAIEHGAYRNIETLILSFPHSNRGFAYPLPAENIECFLTGLERLFEQAGGIPTHLRIDNLPAAVVTVGKGDARIFTESFLAFQAHYRFEVQACNPASGHEKGNVEKKVGYTRQQLFVPEPVMTSFSELADWMKTRMEADQYRRHYRKETTIAALWEEEQSHLLPLPSRGYPISTITTRVVNKYGEVQLDQEKLLVPGARPKQTLVVEKRWKDVTFYPPSGEALYCTERAYMGKRQALPWSNILSHWKQKPRAVPYSRYISYLPEPVQTYLLDEPNQTKTRVSRLLALVDEGYEWLAIAALFTVPGRGEAATSELRAMMQERSLAFPEPWEELHTPPAIAGVETDLYSYDALVEKGGLFDER